MKRVLLPILPAAERAMPLPEEEAHHLLQVLRARNGEILEALDGRGSRMKVEVELLGKGKAAVRSLGAAERDPRLNALPILLEMAVLKGDAMEWTVEKATSKLGVVKNIHSRTLRARRRSDRP